MKRERAMAIPDLGLTVGKGVRKSRRQLIDHEGAQKVDLMMRLPSDLLMKILLRLPAGDVMRCKCVCKELLDLATTPEFVKSHLSQIQSPLPGLLIFDWKAQKNPFKLVEIKSDEPRCGVALNINLPDDAPIPVHGSVNGLLFVKRGVRSINPLQSSEYIQLPHPERTEAASSGLMIFQKETYGFGVSRISGQYKVVRMYMETKLDDCQVYTVGSGSSSWRRIASCSRARVSCDERYGITIGSEALNGNIHWMACDLKWETSLISCFDLETEVFTTFSTPPRNRARERGLSVLGNCLCLCDHWMDEGGYAIDIWLMKEYGDDKTWGKEFVIRNVSQAYYQGQYLIRPIKVFEDGDILIDWETLLHYSNKTKTFRNVDGFEHELIAAIYTPSFLPLKTTFPMENVISF